MAITFERGKTYTRPEIHDALGGSLISYLPRKDGRVVCGCFSADLNPGAPDVVLAGFGREIELAARVFAGQSDAVPVFMKKRSNSWEYVGDFRVNRLSEDPVEVSPHAQRAGRTGEVSLVLFLERVR